MSNDLQKTAAEVRVLDYLDYQEYLRQIYNSMKAKGRKYSYLQLAEDLGFSRTNVLHLFINGKRRLTEKAARKMARRLMLTETEKLYFLNLVRYQNARTSTERDDAYARLLQIKAQGLSTIDQQNQLRFFNQWYHAVIFELVDTSTFSPDPAHLAAILGGKITAQEAEASLDLLQDMGLIAINPAGQFVKTAKRLSTDQEVRVLGVKKYHSKMIELAHESLATSKARDRDITGVTVAADMSVIPQLKREISQFRERMMTLAEQSDDANQVFQLNIQLFPLTSGDK